ncbi:MAG: hypothetical protein R2741_13200 [Methanolobus sp.]
MDIAGAVRHQSSILATEQWFIKIGELKDQMLSEIADVKWYPGMGRLSKV